MNLNLCWEGDGFTCHLPLYHVRAELIGYVGTFMPITKAVTHVFGFSLSEMRAKDKTRAVSDARFALVFLLKEVGHLSTVQIGEYLERHFSSALHAYNVTYIRRRYPDNDDDREFRNKIERARARVGDPAAICATHIGGYLADQTTNPIAVWQVRRYDQIGKVRGPRKAKT